MVKRMILTMVVAANCISGSLASDSNILTGTWIGKNVSFQFKDDGSFIYKSISAARNPVEVSGRFFMGNSVEDHRFDLTLRANEKQKNAGCLYLAVVTEQGLSLKLVRYLESKSSMCKDYELMKE